jgi:hypothetical protein
MILAARISLINYAGSAGPQTVFEFSTDVNFMQQQIIGNMPKLGGDSHPNRAVDEGLQIILDGHTESNDLRNLICKKL